LAKEDVEVFVLDANGKETSFGSDGIITPNRIESYITYVGNKWIAKLSKSGIRVSIGGADVYRANLADANKVIEIKEKTPAAKKSTDLKTKQTTLKASLGTLIQKKFDKCNVNWNNSGCKY